MIENNFDEIARNVQNGTLQLTDAITQVLQFIFLNKPYFALTALSEDDFSEFLLFIYPSVEKSFTCYSRTKASYLTYLQNIIRFSLKSWFRIEKERKYSHKCIINNEYELLIKYDDIIQEQDDFAAEDTPCYNIIDKHKDYPIKEIILVLAMKSCYYLEENHIQKLSELTGIDIDTLWSWKEELDSTLDKKVSEMNKLVNSRNKTFFQKKVVESQLSNIDSETSFYNLKEKSLQYHTRVWNSKNNSNYTRSISPTNNNIARTLNIPIRRINSLISKIKVLLNEYGLT